MFVDDGTARSQASTKTYQFADRTEKHFEPQTPISGKPNLLGKRITTNATQRFNGNLCTKHRSSTGTLESTTLAASWPNLVWNAFVMARDIAFGPPGGVVTERQTFPLDLNFITTGASETRGAQDI